MVSIVIFLSRLLHFKYRIVHSMSANQQVGADDRVKGVSINLFLTPHSSS